LSDEPILSLPVALERLVRSALDDASIHDVEWYAWLNETDADPRFIGHAMWQTDQPHIDYNALFGESPVRERPPDLEKQILTIGEDFCGIMSASRLSIGLALVWANAARRDATGESAFFWLHHTDAIVKLAIASDRIRDLLIVACVGQTPKKFNNSSKKNGWFVTPFREASALLKRRGLQEESLSVPFEILAEQANTLFKHVCRRNAIVHEIASRMATYVRVSVAELQNKCDLEQVHGFTRPTIDVDTDWHVSVVEEHHKEIDLAIDEVCDWYLLLIETSNSVFQIEYRARRLGRK